MVTDCMFSPECMSDIKTTSGMPLSHNVAADTFATISIVHVIPAYYSASLHNFVPRDTTCASLDRRVRISSPASLSDQQLGNGGTKRPLL